MHFLSKHLTFGLNGETRTPCETPYEIRMKSATPSIETGSFLDIIFRCLKVPHSLQGWRNSKTLPELWHLANTNTFSNPNWPKTGNVFSLCNIRHWNNSYASSYVGMEYLVLTYSSKMIINSFWNVRTHWLRSNLQFGKCKQTSYFLYVENMITIIQSIRLGKKTNTAENPYFWTELKA